MQGSFRNLPHRQRVGALKMQHNQVIQDPGKEPFAYGLRIGGTGCQFLHIEDDGMQTRRERMFCQQTEDPFAVQKLAIQTTFG